MRALQELCHNCVFLIQAWFSHLLELLHLLYNENILWEQLKLYLRGGEGVHYLLLPNCMLSNQSHPSLRQILIANGA